MQLKLGLLLCSAALASAACSGTDLALGASATASSAPCGEGCAASNAVDGAAGSRWESAQSDPQWLAELDTHIQIVAQEVSQAPKGKSLGEVEWGGVVSFE